MSTIKFEVRIGTGKSKCSECKKSIPNGEVEFGTASKSFDTWGSVFFRHPGCALKNQITALVEKSHFANVDGWNKLSASQQDTVKKALIERSQEQKKSAASSKKSPKRKKEKEEDGGRKKVKDADAPKKPRSGYLLFTMAKRAEVVEKNPEAAPKEILALLGAEWKALKDGEREEWNGAHVKKDKERYERQLAEFDKTGTFTKTPEEEADEAKKEEKAEKAKKDKKGNAGKEEKKPAQKEEKEGEGEEEEAGEKEAEEEAKPSEDKEVGEEEEDKDNKEEEE